MKTKIEIELEIPEGYEIENIKNLKQEEALNGIEKPHLYVDTYVYLQPIEPPLELESGLFEEMGRVDGDLIFLARQDQAIKFSLTDYELSFSAARDLAKILNYWAEKGRLPDRVVVKEGK